MMLFVILEAPFVTGVQNTGNTTRLYGVGFINDTLVFVNQGSYG